MFLGSHNLVTVIIRIGRRWARIWFITNHRIYFGCWFHSVHFIFGLWARWRITLIWLEYTSNPFLYCLVRMCWFFLYLRNYNINLFWNIFMHIFLRRHNLLIILVWIGRRWAGFWFIMHYFIYWGCWFHNGNFFLWLWAWWRNTMICFEYTCYLFQNSLVRMCWFFSCLFSYNNVFPFDINLFWNIFMHLLLRWHNIVNIFVRVGRRWAWCWFITYYFIYWGCWFHNGHVLFWLWAWWRNTSICFEYTSYLFHYFLVRKSWFLRLLCNYNINLFWNIFRYMFLRLNNLVDIIVSIGRRCVGFWFIRYYYIYWWCWFHNVYGILAAWAWWRSTLILCKYTSNLFHYSLVRLCVFFYGLFNYNNVFRFDINLF